MKFTNEDLLKVMGLKIGDVIKTRVGDIFEIVKDEGDDNFIYLRQEDNAEQVTVLKLSYLINTEFEILPQPKRVGDMKCKDFKTCSKCPLRIYKNVCTENQNNTLFEIFDNIRIIDEEIEAIIEKRLNEEVKLKCI